MMSLNYSPASLSGIPSFGYGRTAGNPTKVGFVEREAGLSVVPASGPQARTRLQIGVHA